MGNTFLTITTRLYFYLDHKVGDDHSNDANKGIRKEATIA